MENREHYHAEHGQALWEDDHAHCNHEMWGQEENKKETSQN